jgi:hypothetical protein
MTGGRFSRGEDGVSLVLVLAFLLIIGVGLGALQTYATTSFRLTKSVRAQRATTYAADGVIEQAIQNIRYNANAGLPAGTPGAAPCDYTPGGAQAINGIDGITVTCTPLSTSGGPGLSNQPRWGILTLADKTQTSEGFIGTGTQDPIIVRGGVFSNSLIKSSVSVDVLGDLWTAGAIGDQCSGASVTTSGGGTKHCGGVVAGDPLGQDPRLLDSASWQPTVTDAPPTVNQSLLTSFDCYPGVTGFRPGTYTSVPNPPALCNKNIWWFEPGTYYFEFPANNASWTIGKNVVAGRPLGWNPLIAASLPVTQACQSLPSQPNNGAQFIFGKESRIHFDNSNVRFEVCAQASDTAQQIALYQMPVDINGLHAPLATGVVNACIRKQPYVSGSAATCGLITYDHPANKPKLQIHGTVYAPLGVIDIDMHNLNSGEVNFGLGMIVRSLMIDVSPSTNCDPLTNDCAASAVGSTRGPREVVYTALRAGKPLLRADVQYDDGPSGTTVGLRVLVKSWTVLR